MFNTHTLIQATDPESRVRVDRGIAKDNTNRTSKINDLRCKGLLFGGELYVKRCENVSMNAGHVINIVICHNDVLKSRNVLRIAKTWPK